METQRSSTAHHLTNVYQTPLITAIQEVRARMGEGSIMGTWVSLESLYSILPPDVLGEVKDDYQTIQRELGFAQRRSQNPDMLVQQVNRQAYSEDIMRKRNQTFLMKIIGSLFQHNYLENLGPKPRIEGQGHI